MKSTPEVLIYTYNIGDSTAIFTIPSIVQTACNNVNSTVTSDTGYNLTEFLTFAQISQTSGESTISIFTDSIL
jgi:hypothetical protein